MLGGQITSFPMKTNTGCAMGTAHSKRQSQEVSESMQYSQSDVLGLSRLLWDRDALRAAHAACGGKHPRGVGNPICSLHQAACFMPVLKTFPFCIMESLLSAKKALRSD